VGIFVMRLFWYTGCVAACLLTGPSVAQRLVDPNAVAPEYREAAETRRAEQIRQRECAHKADLAKVLPRDRTAFLTQCLAEQLANSSTEAAHP
jgi:hypothetical protein